MASSSDISSDPSSSLDRTDPRRLAALFDTGDAAGPACAWESADLGEILRHQLDTALSSVLGRSGAGPGPAPATVGALLADPAPPVALLWGMKAFAKSADARPDGPLPREVATALYYAAILAALVGGGERITELDDAALRVGTEWALRQPWLAAELRPLFQAGLERVSAGPASE